MDVRIIRFFTPPSVPMPLYVHTAGYNKQSRMTRPEGFSAHQLLFARGGQGLVHLPDKEPFLLGPNQYMLMPAGLPHEYDSASGEPWEVGYVTFAGVGTERLMEHFAIEACRLYPMTAAEADHIWRELDAIWEIGDEGKEGSEWAAVRLLYGLLADLNRMLFSHGRFEPAGIADEPQDGGTGSAAVRQAALFLQEHYNENIALSNVAASLGYSHQYLNRLFSQAYGISMLQYVQKIRLDKAVELMDSRDMTVKEIAGRVGMETSYFIRMFRKAKGMTPDQFRKKTGETQGTARPQSRPRL